MYYSINHLPRITSWFAVIALFVCLSLAQSATASAARPVNAEAELSSASMTVEARAVADWVAQTGDNRTLPFVIVDKLGARLFVFDAAGTMLAATPALLGLARGDDSPPGIGDRKLAQMTAAERITPAGRFVAEMGENLAGQDILWIDYAAAVSLHRATDAKPGLTAKSRVARLASPREADRRISHGCVNVSGAFFDRFIRPTFGATKGIVYILPETRSARAEFHMPVGVALATVPGEGVRGL